ncbi:threonylcarbamoyl-AMP synthase [Candidatus Uhrbacteria bacterium]|nr:threonylcarbamoyl-AMP synthase [Candidatus Uhrbacteria bacterium]
MVSEEVKNQIEKAIAILKEGGVVVFPTETAYGLAADATNSQAVDLVYKIKGRVPEKTLPIIAGNREMAESVGYMPPMLKKLADRYWPGPLTLLLPVSRGALAPAIVKNDQIAVRVSSHPIAKALSEGLGAPIVSTSANVHGEPTCYDVASVQSQFEGRPVQPNMYLDIGPLQSELPSTIVGVDDYGYPDVLRQGSIEIDL